ncbi:ATP-binding protein [Flavonifractor plautii]|nr:ATP-binding protein [Flavonifractor plautii]
MENGLRYAASYIRMELTGEEEGGYLLTVENDGAPIPQPTLNVLFQKFYKGRTATSAWASTSQKRLCSFTRGTSGPPTGPTECAFSSCCAGKTAWPVGVRKER